MDEKANWRKQEKKQGQLFYNKGQEEKNPSFAFPFEYSAPTSCRS